MTTDEITPEATLPMKELKAKESIETKETVEQTPTTVELEAEAETEESTEAKTLEDAANLISLGSKALAEKQYEEAAEKLSLAVEIQVSLLGQYALEVAPSFHLYGRALLLAAIQKNSVLGEKADQIKPTEPQSQDGRFVFEEEEDLEDEGQELGELEDPCDDLELAWENLDVARLILSKQSDTSSILQLADVHLSLGDVSLESENFDQACKDYEIALQLKQEHAPEKYRELAEAHFKMGLALEYSDQYELALNQVQMAMDALNKLIEIRKGDGKGKAPASESTKESTDANGEIGELEGFLVELEGKFGDIESLIEREAQGEKIASEAQTQAPVVINDISNLVKKGSPKKRKHEDGESEEKKLKVE